MSNEVILLLVCLGGGTILSVFLLFKIVIEIRKLRKEHSRLNELETTQLQNETLEKRSKNIEEE